MRGRGGTRGRGFATFFEKKVAPKNFLGNGWLEVCTNTSKARLYMKTKAFVYCVLQRIARAIFWVPPPQKIIKNRFAWRRGRGGMRFCYLFRKKGGRVHAKGELSRKKVPLFIVIF